MDIDNGGRWYDYSCDDSSHTLCQIPIEGNTIEYILNKIPEQNVSSGSFTMLEDMKLSNKYDGNGKRVSRHQVLGPGSQSDPRHGSVCDVA